MIETTPPTSSSPDARPKSDGGGGSSRPPAATPATVPAPRVPQDSRARTRSGRSPDGRQWDLVTDAAGVTAVMPTGTVAEARVSERDEQVVIEFWADGPGLPPELGDQLVAQAFSLPAVRPHRPVLLCIPPHSCGILAQAHRPVQDAQTRAAGVTCLLEGRVGGQPSATPGSTPLPRTRATSRGGSTKARSPQSSPATASVGPTCT
jgi:hypothetical protein